MIFKLLSFQVERLAIKEFESFDFNTKPVEVLRDVRWFLNFSLLSVFCVRTEQMFLVLFFTFSECQLLIVENIQGVYKVRVHFKKFITLFAFAIKIICK